MKQPLTTSSCFQMNLQDENATLRKVKTLILVALRCERARQKIESMLNSRSKTCVGVSPHSGGLVKDVLDFVSAFRFNCNAEITFGENTGQRFLSYTKMWNTFNTISHEQKKKLPIRWDG